MLKILYREVNMISNEINFFDSSVTRFTSSLRNALLNKN